MGNVIKEILTKEYSNLLESDIKGAQFCLAFDPDIERVSEFWNPVIFEAELNLSLVESLSTKDSFIQLLHNRLFK